LDLGKADNTQLDFDLEMTRNKTKEVSYEMTAFKIFSQVKSTPSEFKL